MSVHGKLAALAGTWKGKNRLNMSWEPDPIKESASTATVSTRAGETCLEIAYTWEFEGKPQDGFIVISGDANSDKANAVWTDSWHSANVLMNCCGAVSNGGGVNLKGFYKVEGHPDWGWRTEIVPDSDKFKYLMFNVTPEGHEEWAVEMEFTRE
jgi:Protein of unknown function (DUF1579)